MTNASFFPFLLRRYLQVAPGKQTFHPILFTVSNGSRCLSSHTSPSIEHDVLASNGDTPGDLRSRIFRLRFPKRSATAVIENWVAEGRKATAPELRTIAKDLRRSRRFKHALEISEWMRSHHEFDLSDNDYAMRIELIARVFGVSSAEDFFEGLPSAAKSCEAYTSLLHSFAGAKLVDKAECLFERIKDSNLSVGILTFNEMMTLYTSIGQFDKVHIVVEELRRRNVSPDLFTYNLWISACAAALDIESVRKVLNEMALDPNSDDRWTTYAKLADVYITAGNLVSSTNSLDNCEKIGQREWITYDFLLLLQAGLGNINRVKEIWKALRSFSPRTTSRSYICILSSFLVLEKFQDVSEVIDEWNQSKSLDFDISACARLFDGLMKAGWTETAANFQGLMRLKNYEVAGEITT